ncbi:hypothetical protein [Planotetraspora mira]|uniref:Lipoprotein n=1 Tax=Planotetraspora mira TaxID=58121 RepID=A0A8J3TV49_9ACTN|nr:hypothetical protein [Planotetraspora mira]GII33043.1 hypothetical protein Pmi06nite_64850 [Planotetraspora mira]
MNRSSLPIAVALALSGGMLLTACGGGGSDDGDKIQPPATTAAAPTTTAATPSPTPSQAGGPGAPTFDLPSDITADFKGFDSGPKNKAVLQDASYAAKAVLELEARTNTKVTPNFARFFTGERGAAYADSLISQGKDGNVITGTYHYYKPVVKSVAGGNLSVRYCEDQRKAYAKNAKTGKVNVTTPSLSDFRLWTLLMTKSSTGEWQVFDHTWVKGAKQCEVA